MTPERLGELSTKISDSELNAHFISILCDVRRVLNRDCPWDIDVDKVTFVIGELIQKLADEIETKDSKVSKELWMASQTKESGEEHD